MKIVSSVLLFSSILLQLLFRVSLPPLTHHQLLHLKPSRFPSHAYPSPTYMPSPGSPTPHPHFSYPQFLCWQFLHLHWPQNFCHVHWPWPQCLYPPPPLSPHVSNFSLNKINRVPYWMQTEYSFLLCFTPDPLINTSFEQSHIFSVNVLKENY